MLQYRSKDLLEADDYIIAHGCNNKGVMNSGVAKAIREKWPEAFEKYKKGPMNLGSVIFAETADNKLIANCITQNGYGYDDKKYVRYSAIRECFQELDHFCKVHDITTIAIPKIGAGLGGGDWDIIADIIDESCSYAQPVVYIID